MNFTPICSVDDILPNTGVAARVGDRHVAVFRVGSDRFHAIDNIDPRSGASVLARGLVGNYVVVSAGAASAEAAIMEAQALLADGAPSVLVAMFDGPTPDDYARFRDEPEAWYAWAWRVVPARDGLPAFSLRPGMPEPAGDLPHGLDVLRFFLSGERELPGADGGGWTRHA